MAGRIEWFRLGSTAVSVLTFPYSHPAHVLAHWLERFLLQTDPLQNIKKWFYDSMLRFTESRRDSKKVHRSLWLDCCFGKGEPWVWVLAVRMQNSVWEQWLELKHPFPRWLPLLLDHRLFFVLHFWLRLCMAKCLSSNEKGTDKPFFSSTAHHFGWKFFWDAEVYIWTFSGWDGH